MKTLEQQLSEWFGSACVAFGFDAAAGEVTISQRPELSDFQCNAAMKLAKQAGKAPRELAQEIVNQVFVNADAGQVIAEMTIEGPGFINIVIAPSALSNQIDLMRSNARLGVDAVSVPRKITMDYGGLNIAKPMHVGHLRSLMIGESLKRVMRFWGHVVTADVHLGDWGTQMGMVITEVEREQPGLPYFDPLFEGEYPSEPPFTLEDLDKIYPRASERCKEDAEAMVAALRATAELQAGRRGYTALWKHIVNVSLETLRHEVAFLGVDFDLWNGESDYHEWCGQMIERLKSAGFAKESDGALIIELPHTPAQKKELPPLLLTKSDGAYLYGTSDLAAVDERVNKLAQEELVYVVDYRQSLHFEQVFLAARITDIAPESVKLVHAAFGTVNGPDGKPFKTRKGEAMKLWEMVEMAMKAAHNQMDAVNVAREYDTAEREEIARLVGLAALKFADLSNYRMTSYIFDIEKFIQFEGKTGPYLLYAAVRMQSILRKAEESGVTPAATVIDSAAYSSDAGKRAIHELELLIARYPEVLRDVAREYTPHLLAEYVYELSQSFNQFYATCPILAEEVASVQQELLGLVQMTHRTLTHGLQLLGIDVPERM